MIQDIYPHDLDISYKAGIRPREDSLVLHFSCGEFLYVETGDGSFDLPIYSSYPGKDRELVYLFSLDGKYVFLDTGEERVEGSGYAYAGIGSFRTGKPKEYMFAVATAYHLYEWRKSSKYCGRCGNETVHDEKERMFRCPYCGNLIYPRIMPSVIVGVKNGDSLLLTRYNRPGAKLAALVAGFCEIGETAEDTVRREVMEETGIRVKNIRYYASQPWGISAGGLLLGYWCEVDGSDELRADGEELAEAVWVKREDLKEFLSGSRESLTRDMIALFASGEEK